MRTAKLNKEVRRVLAVGTMITMVMVGGVSVEAQTAQTTHTTPTGQTAPAPAPAPSPIRRVPRTTPAVARRVVLQNKPAPPQVVTILHTLNGIKVFRLLRNKEQVEIARLDEAFKIAGGVHTNVIAGLALDDGHTIAAWLPEAEAELPPRPHGARAAGHKPPGVHVGVPAPNVSVPAPPIPPIPAAGIKFEGGLLEIEPSDLRVITREGKRIAGRYLGLDGLTGLSLITLANGVGAQPVDPSEYAITVGQKLRVIGPQPVAGQEFGARSPMYIRIGETEAVVVDVTRAPSGGIARVKIKSAKLSPVNIGGIAINEKGETLGIVNSVKAETATIVPLAMVQMAAKRVIARQASVPRPWLGIRGEPISASSLDRIQGVGWALERARALAEKQQGILLTSVTPGSPAAKAKLKRGDVILSVNNGFIRNAEQFSFLLDEAGPDSSVRFTVARPGKEVYESFDIKLSESPDPFFGLRKFQDYFPKGLKLGSFFGEGVETIALKPKAAVRLGSNGGLLVVSVQPSSDAFKGGLREGDLIESIDGNPIYSGNTMVMVPTAPNLISTYVVVRNREKISLKFKYSDNNSNAQE